MKRALALLAALAAAIAVATPAAAQEGTLKKIKDAGSITIGHRDGSVPFSYYDDKQQARRLCHGPLRAHRRRREERAQGAEARREVPARHLGRTASR
jgi:ABC-type amino acid transport substrate-binding protein